MKVAENNLFWSELSGWALFLKLVMLHGAAEGASLPLDLILCPWENVLLAITLSLIYLHS